MKTYVLITSDKPTELTAFVGPKKIEKHYYEYTDPNGTYHFDETSYNEAKLEWSRKIETAKASRLPVVNATIHKPGTIPYLIMVGSDPIQLQFDTPVELEGWEPEIFVQFELEQNGEFKWFDTFPKWAYGSNAKDTRQAYRLKRSEHDTKCECLGTKDARGNCDSSCAKKHKELYGAGDDYPVIENTWDVPAPLTRRKDRHYAEDWGKFNTAIFGGSSKELIEEMTNYIRKALEDISLQPKPSPAFLDNLQPGGKVETYAEFRERTEKLGLRNRNVIAPGAFGGVDFGHSNDAASYAVYGLGRGEKRDVLDYYKTFNELFKKQKARKKASQSRYKKYKRV